MTRLQWHQRLHWRGFLVFVLLLVLVSLPVWFIIVGTTAAEDLRAVERALAAATVGALTAAALTAVVARYYIGSRFRATSEDLLAAVTGESQRVATEHDEMRELARVVGESIGSLRERLSRLEHEKGRLSALLEGMSEAVVMTDERERVLLANPVAEALLSLPADYEGQRLPGICRVRRVTDLVANVLWTGESMSEEVDVPSGDDLRHISISAAPISGPSGVQGAVIVLYDVTRLRRLERVRRDFVANVSHELRTPIASVQSYAETLQLPEFGLTDVAREFVETIFRNANRMGNIVDDLLTLSRLEAAGEGLEPGTVDMAAVVAQVLDATMRLARDAGATIEVDVSEDVGTVVGERGALIQILQNLVENAIKYTPEEGTIFLTATRVGAEVRVQVSDTGIGIPQQHIPRIFERFYRVDPGRSRQVGGTGLGLAIVKHLVRKLGGRIDVESVEGEGTTFTIWVQVAPEQGEDTTDGDRGSQ